MRNNFLGTNQTHLQLEALTARFLMVDDAMVFGMGFDTNTTTLPCLLSSECIAMSDEMNHASIILGLKLSGAAIRIFKHNDMESLEEQLLDATLSGQPNGKPWKKILIVSEGIFSMDGTIVKLPSMVRLKEKYQAYIYLDEAHSIGSIGSSGRGATDYFKIDPKEIDVLMGTFSKSFGSMGGYVAGSKQLINFLRVNNHAYCYAASMAPAAAQQIITSMGIIMGLDGTQEGRKRIKRLAANTSLLRRGLAKIGVQVFGHRDSPVVPMLVCQISKLKALYLFLTERQVAVVGVCFPIVPLMRARIRFCLSASHTREQIEHLLSAVEEAAGIMGLTMK